MKKLFLTGLLMGLSVAAVAAPTNKAISKTVYLCSGNEKLEVVFVQNGKKNYAVISQMDELIPLAEAKSASGVLYKAVDPNYSYQLFIKGKKAVLSAKNDENILGECTAS
ncbi:MliC family protein [Suttonella ornithocola]|uniref:Lysozyme inhibitor n=1 Tax=Suttonella ornithocola TaxID=279832 RepID=A0A380MRV9_9GAMM|nr:MliC family protein [Suttonella ornithocola]SUO94067.1 lysozyme inhibitor [Suttonella ornithocola]